MAIAYDNASAGGTTASSTLTYSHTTGTLTDGVLIVGVGYFIRTASITGITYGGVAMTLRRRYDDGTRLATSEIWYLVNPPSGANNVAITKSEATAGMSSVALTLSGVDQTTPIEADGANVVFGTHTTHSGSVTTATANAWVVDGLFGTTGTPTATSSQTRRSSSTPLPGGDVYTIGTRGPVATPGSEAASWSFSSTGNASNMIVVSVKPATATAFNQSAAGAFTFAGNLVKTTSKVTAGAFTFSAVLVRNANKALAGSLSPTGALSKLTQRAVAGSLSPSGALVTGLAYSRSVSGDLTPTGALVAQATRGVTGELSFQATLARTMARATAGTLSFAGALQTNLAISQATAGTLSFGGDLVTQYNPPAPGGGGALQRTQD